MGSTMVSPSLLVHGPNGVFGVGHAELGQFFGFDPIVPAVDGPVGFNPAGAGDEVRPALVVEEPSGHASAAGLQNAGGLAQIVLSAWGEDMGEDRSRVGELEALVVVWEDVGIDAGFLVRSPGGADLTDLEVEVWVSGRDIVPAPCDTSL